MKIGISTSVIQRGKTGIAHHLFSLLHELRRVGEEHQFVLFVLEEDTPLFDFLEDSMQIVTVPEKARPAIANILWHQTELPGLAKSLRLDALHVPSYRRLLYKAPCPRVATIHDLAPFHLQGKYDWARMFYGRYAVRLLARRQERIIAVSHTTARDITKYFGVPENRIEVIYNGLNHERFNARASEQDEAVLRHFKLDAPYFLYVARLEHPGKNHVRLIEAFNQFKAERKSNHLLVLGGADWHGAEAIHAAAENSPFTKDIRRVGYISDQQLPALYRQATAMCYPSLFEGFGMPPVEAMACGCPVICSDRGSLAEIASPAACVIDPESTLQISEALKRVSTDPHFTDHLRNAGLRHATQFNWRRAAEKTLAVYEQFAPSRSTRAQATIPSLELAG
jgi:glycosyltransferase involved in cell wall biosynthesis